MTALALRSAGDVNAVSKLHGEVTRTMWAPMWPDLAPEERPVRFITNGVHVPTWIASDVSEFLARHFGPNWIDNHDDPAVLDGILAIPDEEIWAMRQALRRYLFTFVRERARQRWTIEHVAMPRVVAAGTLLEPDSLTLGFARRFTAYKRPELIFHDPERLAQILNRADRPVQIIFAGKSHPADDVGSSAAARLQACARSEVRRAPRLHRRLRHARGALSRAGLRRVAQQPAQAARSQRHERHEGRTERRAAPQHRRRLVGGRVQRRQRLGD
jgi:alpha-glucan phosphorylase-like protein